MPVHHSWLGSLWALFKARQWTPNEVANAKCLATSLSFNYSFSSPRSGLFSQSFGSHLASTCQAICLHSPCWPLRESDLAITNLLFSQYSFLVPAPFCLLKSFILHRFLELFSIFQIVCCLIHESLNKANKIFKMYAVEFCFVTVCIRVSLLKGQNQVDFLPELCDCGGTALRQACK